MSEAHFKMAFDDMAGNAMRRVPISSIAECALARRVGGEILLCSIISAPIYNWRQKGTILKGEAYGTGCIDRAFRDSEIL